MNGLVKIGFNKLVDKKDIAAIKDKTLKVVTND
jgi:hypothetical protein